MRYPVGFLVVALLAPAVAAAQSTTADGIRALARGDTGTGLRILRPLVDASEPDPLAQFFLEAVYATGAGVPIDPIRACGLYLKSATSTNPLASQAVALADAMQRLDGLGARCATANIGVWGEPPPAHFVLGSDHWVTTDASGFTIGYRGTTRAVPTTWGGQAWVFLPTRYTRLMVTRPVATARHFIEFWFWVPDDVQTPTAWSLVWSVSEVIGAEAHAVGNGVTVVHVDGSRPPAAYAVDATGRLQVNVEGDVERVTFGPNAQTRVMPSPGAP